MGLVWLSVFFWLLKVQNMLFCPIAVFGFMNVVDGGMRLGFAIFGGKFPACWTIQGPYGLDSLVSQTLVIAGV